MTASVTADTLVTSQEPAARLDQAVAALKSVPLATATNTTPAAGHPGELLQSAVLVANTASLTTATPKTIASLTLTPGDWVVDGNVSFVPASAGGTTGVTLAAGVNTTTNALGLEQYNVTDVIPLQPAFTADAAAPVAAQVLSGTVSKTVPLRHVQVAAGATQVVYLVANAVFTAGAVTAYGTIHARRAS